MRKTRPKMRKMRASRRKIRAILRKNLETKKLGQKTQTTPNQRWPRHAQI